MNIKMPPSFIPNNKPDSQSPEPVKNSIKTATIVAPLLLAGISYIIVVILFALQVPDGDRAVVGYIVLASTIALPIYVLFGALVGLASYGTFKKNNIRIAPVVASVIILAISTWAGISIIGGQVRDNHNTPIYKSSHASRTADCSSVNGTGSWQSCVQRTMVTDADFQECLHQADQSQMSLSWGVCGLEYSLKKQDPSICNRVGAADNIEYCQSQYSLRGGR